METCTIQHVNGTTQNISWTEWAKSRTLFWHNFLCNKLGINANPPIVKFSTRYRVCAGSANSHTNTIIYGITLLYQEKDKFDATIAHEVSHIVADIAFHRRCKHDNHWRYVFGLTGYPVKRCHTYDVVKNQSNRISIKCLCGKFVSLTKNRITRIKNNPYISLRHLKCGQIIPRENIIKWH